MRGNGSLRALAMSSRHRARNCSHLSAIQELEGEKDTYLPFMGFGEDPFGGHF
jgi:hypothetical protein